MSRSNRLIELVFSDIVGSDERVSSYDKFLSTDKALDIPLNLHLKETKALYQKLVNKQKVQLENLARVEETIVQLRCYQMSMMDYKLSLVREYIYARCLFFRLGKDVKDIRVVVGRTDIWGNDLEALRDNKEFTKEVKEKLETAMMMEIRESLKLVEMVKSNVNEQVPV